MHSLTMAGDIFRNWYFVMAYHIPPIQNIKKMGDSPLV